VLYDDAPYKVTLALTCVFAAMTFESCADDPRSSNVLRSPEFTLSSSQELAVSMESVSSGDYSLVQLYKTSTLGIISTRLNSFTWDPSALPNITFSTCLPAGTYQLAFVAPDVSSDAQSVAAVSEVLLTNSLCTYATSEGRPRYKSILNRQCY